MSDLLRRQGFTLVFIGLAVYQLVRNDLWEATLYFLVGLAFLCNGLALSQKDRRRKKALTTGTWVLIVVASVLFLYMLQFK